VEHVAARMEEVKLMERRLLEHQPPPEGKLVMLPGRGRPDTAGGEGMRLHGGKRAFQKLPKHMRRRAASHNVNRVPSAVRRQAIRERERAEEGRKGAGEKGKRQQKRPKKPRAKDLHARRVRSGALWLETHLWARKRMHLQLLWGWQLPVRASDKGQRAAYKNARNVCTAYDLSYLRVVRMTAAPSLLTAVVSQVTDSGVRPLPTSELYRNGCREGEMGLYRRGGVGQRFIAPVTFLWVTEGQLLLWVHPSAIDEAVSELTAAMAEVRVSTMDDSHDTDVRMDSGDSNPPPGVLLLPPGELLRFRLTGPRANAILHAVLTLSNGPGVNAAAHELWRSLEFARSCAELASGVTLALHVEDPRHSFPPPPTKLYLSQAEARRPATATADVCKAVAQWPSRVGSSPLLTQGPDSWPAPAQQEALARAGRALERRLKAGCDGDVEMAEAQDSDAAREKSAEAATLPLLLIQQSSAAAKGGAKSGPAASMGSGWDVVLPSGWGMALWPSLIHAGCRAVGLRDVRKLHQELAVPCFPYDYPDTVAYEEWSAAEEKELRESYERKPPGKRVNYAKLAVAFPFSSPWQTLAEFWSPAPGDVNGLSVLRGERLRQFSAAVESLPYSDSETVAALLWARTWQPQLSLGDLTGALVMVRVEMESMGTAEEFSILTMPGTLHLDALRKLRADSANGRGLACMEETAALQTSPGDPCHGMWSFAASQEPLPVVGFVASAGHSYARGKGTALAFCPAAAYAALVTTSSGRTTALLRTPTHKVHRFARLALAL